MAEIFPGFDPAAIGQRIANDGPDVLLDEIENLLPDEARELIGAMPLSAVALGVGVGVWLGLTKTDEVISAGKALLAAAAGQNIAQVMEKMKG